MHMFPWEYPLKETEIIVLIEIMIFFFFNIKISR